MRFLWITLAALMFAPACKDGEDPEGDADADADGDSDADADADGDVPAGEPDETIEGDLADGEVLSSLDWAHDSAVACWVAPEDVNFNGNHVFHQIDKEGLDYIVVRGDPESGVDISVYVLEFTSVQTPPDVTSARCEAGFDDQNDNNPGQAEVVNPIIGFPDKILLVGVAGANGTTSGAYTLDIWKRDANDMESQ